MLNENGCDNIVGNEELVKDALAFIEMSQLKTTVLGQDQISRFGQYQFFPHS